MRRLTLAVLCAASAASADERVVTSSFGGGVAVEASPETAFAQGVLQGRSRYGFTDHLSVDGALLWAFGHADPHLLLGGGIAWEVRATKHVRLSAAAGLPLEIPLRSGANLAGGLYGDLQARWVLAWGAGATLDLQATYLRTSTTSNGWVELMAVVGLFSEFDAF